MRRVLGSLWLCLGLGAAVHAGEVTTQVLSFSELAGWEADDHAAALAVFQSTSDLFAETDWRALSTLAGQTENPKSFFELYFRPVLIQDTRPPLFTGYFEPELRGARSQDTRFNVPLYRMPEEAKAQPWLTRREITTSDVMQGRGLEIVWLENAVDKFFLQVQGSGRIRLDDGAVIRVGYGGKNGHEYKSIGQELVRHGVFSSEEMSAEVIRDWVLRNPEAGADLLNHNPSYVFFRELTEVSPDQGPLGTMKRPVTAHRTIAVDPDYVQLGVPVWIEKDGPNPIRRLMVAQDTGSAIKGAQRADIFFGTGEEAGKTAGQVRDPGRMVQLLPTQRAFAMATEAVR